MGLTLQMSIKKSRLILRLSGELDQASVVELRKKTSEIIKRYGIVNIVFNLQNLTFMDSSGIGFIISRYSEVKRKGGEIVICSMNECIMKIFNISGLRRICKVSPNEVYADKLLGVCV